MPLTKTGYLAFKRCHKAFWLANAAPELATPLDAATQRRLRVGREVDARARAEFADGVLIPAQPEAAEMAALTAEAIATGAAAIFQATFLVDDLLVKVDVLQKTAVGWHLIEVKSSTRYKEAEHLLDVAFQVYVLQQAGLTVTEASLMHLNPDCDSPDCPQLFLLHSAHEAVAEVLPHIAADVAVMRQLSTEITTPDVDIGRHCLKPDVCRFKAFCWRDVADWTIYEVPYLRAGVTAQLEEAGIRYVADIPPTLNLRHKQATAFVQRMQQQTVSIDVAAIREALAELVYPLYFFDFETIDEAVPRFAGCKPYQQVPFQYSCHVLTADGSLSHYEYLHTMADDPREALTAALLDHIGETGSIIAYNIPFERGVLRHLSEQLPHYASRLDGMIARLWDQLPLLRRAYVHHAFGNSYSLKSVLPVLAPALSYKALEVQNGAQAQVVWERLIRETDSGLRAQLTAQLVDYCHLDTLAMVEIHKVLQAVTV